MVVKKKSLIKKEKKGQKKNITLKTMQSKKCHQKNGSKKESILKKISAKKQGSKKLR